MAGSVDLPEKLGVRTIIGPFNLDQMMRIAIYLLIVAIMVFFLSIYFIILSFIAVLSVYLKKENEDLDLYLLKYARYSLSKQKFGGTEVHRLIQIHDLKDDIIYLNGEYMLIIEATGLNIRFYNEEEQNRIYLQFINILNSIDFDFDIKIVASRFDYAEYINIAGGSKKAADQYLDLIKSLYTEQKLYRYYLVLKHSRLSINANTSERMKEAGETLNSRADHLKKALENIKIDSKILRDNEILKFLEIINLGGSIL